MSTETLDDLDTQLAAAYRDPVVADMGKPKVRKAREKQHLANPEDGRSKRKTGRVEQFNIKVRPGLKDRMNKASRIEAQLRKVRHVPVGLIVEELCEAYLQALEKRRHAP